MLRVAVFGCNGFLGRHMVKYLTENDIVNSLHLFDIQEESIFQGYIYNTIDISDLNQVSAISFEFDIIYFFSGLTGTEVSNDEAEKFVKVNELGLLNVLNCIIKYPKFKNKIIFPSTRLVYKGVENELLNEESPKEFKTIYALNKFSCENILKIYGLKYNLRYSILRVGVPYGNEMDGKISYGTIGFFLELASKGLNISVLGNGEMRRTFTHVNDICKQFFDVGILENSNYETFNICGENLSIIEVANMIANKYNVEVEFKNFSERELVIESGDTIFDFTKINTVLKNFKSIKFKNWIV
jgi:UDP-glucose 4-epimerase